MELKKYALLRNKMYCIYALMLIAYFTHVIGARKGVMDEIIILLILIITKSHPHNLHHDLGQDHFESPHILVNKGCARDQ